MRVLFLNPVGAIGGAEKVLLTMMGALRAIEPTLEIYLIVCTDGPLVAAAQNLGVTITVLELPERISQLGDSGLKGRNRFVSSLSLLASGSAAVLALVNYLRTLQQVVRQIQPDLIHSNGIKTHLLSSLISLNPVPRIWHIHDFYGTRPLIARLLRWCSRRAAVGFAISQAVAEDARATLANLPIALVYNAIDTDFFAPAPALPSDFIRIGLVATFARWKGQDVFLAAAAQLSHQCPDLNLRFYIVGGPIYQTKGSQFSELELRELAAGLNIADKVELMGFQSEVVEVYRWLDIVVHASTQPEPFGLAIVEAMACGKPVVVSQAGGAAELFTPGYDAIGVQPSDVVGLAAVLEHLVRHPEQRQQLGEQARTTAVKRFSCDRLGQEILDRYQSLLPTLIIS